MLSIRNLTKSFADKKVLNDIHLQVKRGEIAVLLGSSGVGKSTLLRVLNNLDPIDSGSVELDDQTIDLSLINTTSTIGMVFQQFNLFEHLTILENITLALTQVKKLSKENANKIALDLLEHYGLQNKSDAYPKDLSGGQKQRIALARTLALKPTVVCLDEPTSALDPLLTAYVSGIIQQLATENYIVLVATHDTTLLERLDCTIYLMHNGKIIESASSHELKKNPAQFKKISNFIAGKEH